MKMSHILSVMVIAIFCTTGIAFTDNWKYESGKKGRGKPQYHQRDRDGQGRSDHRNPSDNKRYDDRRQGDHQKRHDNRGQGNSKKRHHDRRKGDYQKDHHKRDHDYHKYHGYRDRPYQKHRHYTHHNHKGHRYEYRGHWRSWQQWDRYMKAHPVIYKHGDYYRENAHLMFRFRDPVTGSFFFFSIGR